MSLSSSGVPAHNVFTFGGITFSSNFDNGNLAKVEQVPNNTHSFRIWTAPDNMGTTHQSKHCAWYYFMVSGLPQGCVLRIQIVNTSNHSGLYKYDMRPVYRSNATNQRWVRIKSSVRFSKEASNPQLFFEHGVEVADDKLFFAFTYPYTYAMVQNELAQMDAAHVNNFNEKGSIFFQRELVTNSLDGRRIDLLTITSVEGRSTTEREPLLSGLFPEARKVEERPPVFPEKEIVFVSARVHSGEVPAQHTFKGILSLLMDPNDLRARELRARYVFKLIPMLNPDGVYRGHFRMDQLGQNLNRYYTDTDPLLQPAIFAAKSLTDHFASIGKLSVYLDFHAHASKRGCFIYGNVLDTAEDQIQNQLYCKLIALNSAHFDYEGCLFSKDHMTRIDPGDQAKGLTAEGSGRVSMYLAHGIIHSYTIECNYNTSRVGNEIVPCDNEPGGECVTAPSPFTTSPDKYTPAIFAGVGRACVIALLDIRGHNPCSRISKSKFKTLDRVRNSVMMEVRSRKEYIGKAINKDRRRNVVAQERKVGPGGEALMSSDDLCWRRVVETAEPTGPATQGNNNLASGSSKAGAPNGSAGDGVDRSSEIFFIPMKEPRRRRSFAPEAPLVGARSGQSSDNSAYNSSNNSSRSETPRTSTTSTPLRSSSLKAAPVMPPKVTHLGDNTCLPVNAFTPHLSRRTVAATDRNVGMQDLSRENSSGRLTSASPFGPDRPDSRSSTPSQYGNGASPALNLPAVNGSAGGNLSNNMKDMGLQATPLLCPTGKRITPSAPQGNMSSSSTVGSSGSSKVGRNILGKKLHAAGVALLMGNTASLSADALDDLDQANWAGQVQGQGQGGDSIDNLAQYQLRPVSNPPPSMRPLSAGARSPRAQREQVMREHVQFSAAAQGIAVQEDFAFLSITPDPTEQAVPSPHGLRRQHSMGASPSASSGALISPVKSIRSPLNRSPKD